MEISVDEVGRTLVGVDKPVGFLKPSSEEAEDDVVVWELKDDGSVSDLETERDFFDFKSFPGMILASFMVERGVKMKMKMKLESSGEEREGRNAEKERRRIGV